MYNIVQLEINRHMHIAVYIRKKASLCWIITTINDNVHMFLGVEPQHHLQAHSWNWETCSITDRYIT